MKNIIKFIFILLISLGLIFNLTSCEPTNDSGDSGDEEYTLTINIQPEGAGSVSPESGSYPADQNITITATPNIGYVFAEWTGDHTSIENPTSIILDSDYTITAVFTTESDGTSWSELTSSAQWSARSGHTSLVYNNKIWVLGGTINQSGTPVNVNDVWWSEDGINWTEATTNAEWGIRTSHASVVYDGKMWVFAGLESSTDYWGDAWYSTDGETWTEASSENWGEDRKGHSTLVFDDKMLIIGGAGFNPFSEIWSSTDGINWTQETDGAWSARMHHASALYEGSLWIMGGQTAYGGTFIDDVWTSEDLTSWTEETSLTLSDEYYGHTALVYADKLWILGGNGNKQGVWHYKTGDASWTQASSDAFPERAYHTAVSFKGKMYVIGGAYTVGMGFDYRNDVYVSD
jgi:hypothetical protein